MIISEQLSQYFLKFLQDFTLHAIDWDGPLPCDSYDSVEVPETSQPLTEEDYQDLTDQINPLSHSSEHAIDIYLNCLSFVQERITF